MKAQTRLSDKKTTPAKGRGVAGMIAIALVVAVCAFLLFSLAGCEPYEDEVYDEGVAALPAFDDLDTDTDGVITTSEAQGVDVVTLNFERADANRDGLLTEKEYSELTPNVDVLENADPLENDSS